MSKTVEEKKFQQSYNNVQIVGTLEEINLKVEDEVTNKETGKIDKRGARIMKNDFKNPAFTIKSNDGVFGVEIIPTYEKVEKDGELKDNPKFKALKTIMDYERGTRVVVDGSLAENGYIGNDGEYKSTTQIQMFQMSSNAPKEDLAEGTISGIIKSIKEEKRGDDETGRLLVEFYMTDYTGAMFPVTLVVEEKYTFVDEDGEEGEITADDFTDAYSKGDSVFFNVEIVSKTVGGTTKKKAALGRGSKVKRGFTVTEFRFVGGDEVIEEPDEDEPTKNDKYYVSVATFKKAMADRDVMIEAKKEDKKNGGSSSASDSPKRGLGRKSKVEVEEDIEDDPFN